jgi:hypothetical protein
MNKTIGIFLALILGIAAFFLVVGPNLLDPSNIGWIRGADPEQQYIGWFYFRNSLWTFPIGLSPDFGLTLASSIVYTDSTPLMALILKPFNAWLPETFQYFGIWVLISFILQAVIGYQLIGLFSQSLLIRLIGAGLLVFVPTMIVRIGFHNNVAGHFQILLALYLLFRQQQGHRMILWGLVLTSALLVNFYLYIIVMALWLADLIDKKIRKELTFKQIGNEFILLIFLVLFVGWQAGYFEVGKSISAGIYGLSRMNVLSPIDTGGWSYFLPSITPALNSYEGYSYFGAGILLCALFAIGLLLAQKVSLKPQIRHYPALFLLLICCTLFAITNQVDIGSRGFHYPLPKFILYLGTILRESTRLFWPVYYVIILAIIYVIVKGLPKKVATAVLAIGLFVQIVDTSAGWLPVRQKIAKDSAGVDAFTIHLQAFRDPFWDAAGKHYKKVLVVPAQQPPGKIPYDWEKYASYAAKYRMGTNSAYLARVDQGKLDAFHANFEQKVAKGEFDPQAIYILGPEKLLPVAMHLDASKDLLARINGMNVLAPGWKTCTTCPQVPADYEIHPVIPRTSKDKAIDFSSKGEGKHFLVGVAAWQIVGWGWAFPEAFGVWSEGDKVKLTIPLPKEAANDPITGLELEMRALISPNYPKQTVEVWVNSQFQKKVVLTENQGNRVLVDIPPSNNANTPKLDYVTIELRLPNKAKPKDLGLGDDTRELAIGLVGGVWR